MFYYQDDDAETIREAFKLFDRDQDGYITCKELKKVKIVIKIIVKMVTKRDQDGYINITEKE